MKIEDIKLNKKNPRKIKEENLEKLANSIREFPKMMELRPMVIDKDNTIIGGNMRYLALKKLGYKEVPDAWVKKAEELSEEEIQRFIVTDNRSFGEWDFNALKEEFVIEDLLDWGFNEKELKIEEDDILPEVPFTELLGENHNYIVLYFDNDIDWLQAQSLLELKDVKNYSTRKDGKEDTKNRRTGIGRVIKGRDFFNKIDKKDE